MNVLSLQRLKFTFKYFPQILQQSFFIFIFLQAINFSLNQVMIYLQEARMTSKEDFFVPLIIFLAFIGFFVQSTIKVLWILIVCRFFQGQDTLGHFLKRHTEQGLIEALRAFLKSILYGFLFIIPGLIKMIRFQFVIYIVALEKKYEAGELDALKTSENLAHGKTLQLMLLVVIFALFGLATTSSQLVTDSPLKVLGLELATLCMTTIECLYFYLTYTDLKNQKGLRT